MTIYQDSKRIVGLSTDTVETITLDEDFSSYSDQTAFDNAWVSLDTAKNRGNPTNDNLDVVLKTDNSDDTMAYNLGSSLSDSAWVCRFKWNITGLTRNNTSAWHGWIGLSSTNQTGEFDDSQDSMGLTILTQNTGGNTMFWYASGSSAGVVNEQNSQFDDDVSTGTYYIEMIRNADVITVNVYTDSNYSSLLDGGSNTITGTVTGLQYFKVANKTGNYSGTITSTIDDLKIWNGVTSISSKPSNVQDNSLLVEKDTARRYWFTAPTSVDTEDVYDEITGRTDVSVFIAKESPNHSNGEGRYLGLEINDNAGGQALVGKGVKKIKVRLYRGTALTGTYTVGIMDSSGTVKGFSDHDASEVTGSSATYSHTMNNAVILAVGDIIFINYTATTNPLYLRTNNITNGYGSNYSGAFSPRSVTTGTTWVASLDGDASRLWMFDFDFAPATDQIATPATWTRGYFPITRGVIAGGEQSPVSDVMDYITIATTGNALDFGDLTQARYGVAGMYSDTRGVFACGYNGGYFNIIDYITILTAGNATDFGDSSTATYSQAGVSNKTRGVFASNGSGRGSNLDYITIATTGNATSGFGSLTRATTSIGGNVNSETRGVFLAGNTSGDVYSNVMDYITIDTAGNAIDFGDLTVGRYSPAGLSSETRGVIFGGNISGGITNNIDYITIDTTGNATDFGDLSSTRSGVTGGLTNNTRGVMAGGSYSGGRTNVIEYITIDTAGNATDFGDLTLDRSGAGGVSG